MEIWLYLGVLRLNMFWQTLITYKKKLKRNGLNV